MSNPKPSGMNDDELAEIRDTNPKLANTLESFLALGRDAPPDPPTPIQPAPAKVIQLPLWPEARRAAPNAFFRSALFPALKFKEGRPSLKRQRIYAVGGIDVFFMGERFDQSDLDVYLELLDLAHFHPLGTECGFAAHAILKRLHHATGNANHKWLHSVLLRTCAALVEITDHKKTYFGHLIEGGFKDELTRHYRVTINPKFAALFGYGMWSSIDREQRRALGRNATAKCLHAYYSTHAPPGAHSFETLAAIAGLDDSNKRRQRIRIIDAHKLLTSEDVGFLSDYTVSEDGSTIKAHINNLTPSQARHIAKKVIRQRRERAQRPVE
jgi:hypothetical protein